MKELSPIRKGLSLLAAIALLQASPILAKEKNPKHCQGSAAKYFQRISSFPVYLNTDIDTETVAEIVDVSMDGKTLVYTDGATENIGFVDISNPQKPKADGVLAVGGEPTSVAVAGRFALAAVNTSESFTAPSGKLLVIDIKKRVIVTEIDLGGQPDAVAVSHDRRYAAVVIENERDEDLGDGEPPQPPSGFLQIVDLKGHPKKWSTRAISLDRLADLFPEDAEPEYVDINKKNQAVVTMQENNHIVVVDLPSGKVVRHFNAGTVDLTEIDTLENELIELNSELEDVPREPDGVSWMANNLFATADEGDLYGGSRGFTVYSRNGKVTYTSGNDLEHAVVRLGHYPEDRSENKGNEPENVEVGRYGKNTYLFVASERASVVFVYQIDWKTKALHHIQTLPTGVGPEGIKAIGHRGLFVAANEVDDRGDKIRSSLTIYRLSSKNASYPTIHSVDRVDGTPIPWGALSGLAADPTDDDRVFTVHDSFYQQSRIYSMDINHSPAVIDGEIILSDADDLLKSVEPSLVNEDDTVKLDLEGIATRSGGGFWLASEGAGTVGEPDRPLSFLNLLVKVSAAGVIEEVVTLPDAVNARQVRFGFEGVAAVDSGAGEMVYVAFQREWAGDPAGHVRIGRYDTANKKWAFYSYPLDTPLSANGGWVGLSELTALGMDQFAVIERDNQAGPDAAIKRIYKFSLAGLNPIEDAGGEPSFPVVTKKLVHDLMPDLQQTGGLVLEKIEGMTVVGDGKTTLVVNDNDGVDDSNGETQLLHLKDLFE